MKIDKIYANNYQCSFGGGIDVHAHKGSWWVELSDCDVPKNSATVMKNRDGKPFIFYNFSGDLFEQANKCIVNPKDKIDLMIVSNLDCMVRNNPDVSQSSNFPNGIPFFKDEIQGNLELLRNSKNLAEYLYATGQPGIGKAENLRRVIETAPEKFVGIKLHPEQLNIPANNEVYNPYMQLAQEKKLPVLFHSGVNIEWKNGIGYVKQELCPSDPRFIYELAKKYSDVPVILGHTGAGGAPAHEVAIKVMRSALEKKDANLYCDISWMDFCDGQPMKKPENILDLIKLCKEKNAMNRILFGSDIPVGEYNIYGSTRRNNGVSPEALYKNTVDRIKQAIRNDNELRNEAENIIEKIFYKNAEELFFKGKQIINEQTKTAPPKVKKFSKTKMGIAAGIGAALIGFAGYLFYNKPAENKADSVAKSKPAALFNSFKVKV